METKELEITIPENHEIDWQESAKQEKIVFKKKDTKPRSWEEYCNNYAGKVFYIEKNSTICGGHYTHCGLHAEVDKNVLPSKELSEAFLAMMQLMSLRQEWIGDWEANWSKGNYCVVASKTGIFATTLVNFTHPLSFPTQEMATDFMNCFKDLLEIAKSLV